MKNGTKVRPIQSADEEQDCLTHRANLDAYLSTTTPDTVFVIQSYGWADRLVSKATGQALVDEWAAADTALATMLEEKGVSEVVFVSAPPQGTSIVDCATGGSSPRSCITSVPSYWPSVLEAQKKSEHIVVDQSDWFCAAGKCPVINGDYVIRRDHVHPTKQYAALIAGPFRARYDAAAAAG